MTIYNCKKFHKEHIHHHCYTDISEIPSNWRNKPHKVDLREPCLSKHGLLTLACHLQFHAMLGPFAVVSFIQCWQKSNNLALYFCFIAFLLFKRFFAVWKLFCFFPYNLYLTLRKKHK